MQFTFAVKKLDDRLKLTMQAIEKCKELYEQEGINEPQMLDTFEQTQKNIEELKKSLANILAANERKFDMIEFLIDALKMEHHIVAELQSYLSVISDEELRNELNKFLAEEKKHENMLAGQIRALGGDPQIQYKVAARPEEELSIIDLLVRHRQMDQQTKKHYDVGLSRFKEPEFQWILGQLAVEEERHLQELDKLIEKYREQQVLPDDLKNIKWYDPYMGKPGDRSWVE